MSSDEALVEAARRGDAASLGLLLERYRAPLYGLALRILGRGSEAQDAVHDTFLIALRKIDEVREPAAVGGWLHAVLRGRERIAECLRDVCGSDIESRIEDEVLGEQRVAFNEACRYPDGTRVLSATTLEVRDGEISRQVSVEAWDE